MTMFIIAVLSALGGKAMQRLLDEPDPWLAYSAAPLVFGLAWIGCTTLTRHILPFDLAWQLSFIVLAILHLGFGWRSPERPEGSPLPVGKIEVAGLLLLAACCYFVVHTREMLAPEDDFFIHFPEIALISRGCIPPVNPFLPEMTLFGHFGRDLWLAILSRLNGNDILAATWGLNHSLQLLSLLLAWRLARSANPDQTDPTAGPNSARSILLPWFLFCGISVGSRVGLLDTYDNNNALVYAGLLLFFYLFQRCRNWSSWVVCGLTLGCYTVVYETHALLLIMVLSALTVLQAPHFEPRSRGLAQRALAILVALTLGGCLGGPLQDLALRLAGFRQANLGHQEVYEGQRVQVHFPKAKLFQIDLGAESYRRQSYVLQMPLFEKLLPPLDAGGYTYIWHPKVLEIHWVSTWLGLFCGYWLWKQRNWVGLSFWFFGWFSYLTPALVDFGTLHEKEYFRWEFAAGFGFAGALAQTLVHNTPQSPNFSQSGQKLSRWWFPVIILALWGGEKRVNESLIEVQRCQRLSGPVLRQKHMRQWLYPSSHDWLLSHEAFHLSSSQIDLARRLRDRLPTPGGRLPRVLTDVDARSRDSLGQESVLSALMAAPVVGHQAPPRWMPDGIAPYFHTPAWSAFWWGNCPEALGALDPDCIFRSSPNSRPLARVDLEVGQCQAQLLGRDDHQSLNSANFPPFPSVKLRLSSEPTAAQPEWPSWLEFDIEGSIGLSNSDWRGPLTLRLTGQALDPVSELPMVVSLSQGRLRIPFVPPLHRGPSQWTLLHKNQPLAQGDWKVSQDKSPFEAWLETVQAQVARQGDRLQVQIFSPPKDGPYRVGLRYFNGERRAYETPFGFSVSQELRFEGPPAELSLELDPQRLQHPQSRIDIFLVSYAGWEQKVGQFPPNSSTTAPESKPSP